MTEAGRDLRCEAVVLAAGAGSRFGGGKLLAPWKGGVLLDGALAAAFTAPVRSVRLVWGADERVCDAARAFAERAGQAGRLHLVRAGAFARGLSQSLKAGIESLPADCDGAFVFLGDMPKIPPDLPARLALALAEGIEAAAPTHAGSRGHPVLFRRSQFAALAALSGDRGGGELLSRLGPALALVETSDDGVLFDVDRREDL